MIHASIEKSTIEPVILVITGSTRPSRLGPKIAAWVIGVAKKFSGLKYELVDLADWPLPMDDEPAIPQTGIYAQKHTQDWSRKIASADAIIFVTP
jgi:NAD(P)H-dependent FMN reductase